MWIVNTSFWIKGFLIGKVKNSNFPGSTESYWVPDVYSLITLLRIESFFVSLIISISLKDLYLAQSGWVGSSTDA